MSILMDALKQQVPVTVVAYNAAIWRVTAIVLALLLAVLLGFIGGYFLLKVTTEQPMVKSAVASAADVTEPVIASATSIALRLEPAAALTPASDQTKATDTLTLKTPAAEIDLAKTVQSPPQAELLPVRPPMVTVTAPSQNAATAELNDSAVSEELQQLFASALAATERPQSQLQSQSPSAGSVVRNHQAPAQDIRSLDRQLQQQIPSLRFEAHVYATSPGQRWVKVNGKTLQEGQWITADIRLREITPQYVLMEFGQQLFSMTALSDWR